jgi:hypothetical protein
MDSQYSHYPEDYLGLLTLKKAKCGGVISYLLSLEEILKEQRASNNGNETERILRETDFPFIVLNVFKKTANEERDPNFFKAISNGVVPLFVNIILSRAKKSLILFFERTAN